MKAGMYCHTCAGYLNTFLTLFEKLRKNLCSQMNRSFLHLREKIQILLLQPSCDWNKQFEEGLVLSLQP